MRDLQHAQSIRIGKNCVQDSSNVPHRLRRERPPVWVGFGTLTTVIVKTVNSGLNLRGRQIVEADLAQFTNQVLSELAVPFDCFRCAASACMFLEPVVEKLSEGRPGAIGGILRLLSLVGTASCDGSA